MVLVHFALEDIDGEELHLACRVVVPSAYDLTGPPSSACGELRRGSLHSSASLGTKTGGAEEARTPDPHNAIVVLYQLSYDPNRFRQFNGRAPFVKAFGDYLKNPIPAFLIDLKMSPRFQVDGYPLSEYFSACKNQIPGCASRF